MGEGLYFKRRKKEIILESRNVIIHVLVLFLRCPRLSRYVIADVGDSFVSAFACSISLSACVCVK